MNNVSNHTPATCREQPGYDLAKPIGIGHHPPGPAELNRTEREHHQGEVVDHGVRLPALMHPQSIVYVERLLSLLDQGELLGNVVAERIPGQNYNKDKNQEAQLLS